MTPVDTQRGAAGARLTETEVLFRLVGRADGVDELPWCEDRLVVTEREVMDVARDEHVDLVEEIRRHDRGVLVLANFLFRPIKVCHPALFVENSGLLEVLERSQGRFAPISGKGTQMLEEFTEDVVGQHQLEVAVGDRDEDLRRWSGPAQTRKERRGINQNRS